MKKSPERRKKLTIDDIDLSKIQSIRIGEPTLENIQEQVRLGGLGPVARHLADESLSPEVDFRTGVELLTEVLEYRAKDTLRAGHTDANFSQIAEGEELVDGLPMP